jgi:hypothetical protein
MLDPNHITKNFTWNEFKVSAERPDLAETIVYTLTQKTNLEKLVVTVLQPIRDFIREPVTILSGVRNPILNSVIGGTKDSDHLYGMAADITSSKIVDAENIVAYSIWDLKLPIRQLIYYPGRGFIHISINSNDKPYKHELLRYDGNNKYSKVM